MEEKIGKLRARDGSVGRSTLSTWLWPAASARGILKQRVSSAEPSLWRFAAQGLHEPEVAPLVWRHSSKSEKTLIADKQIKSLCLWLARSQVELPTGATGCLQCPVACCLLQHRPASPCLSLMPSLPSRPNMPASVLTFDWKKKKDYFFQVNIHPFFHQSFNQNNHQLQLLIIHLASLLTTAGLNGWNSVCLCPLRTSSAPSVPYRNLMGAPCPRQYGAAEWPAEEKGGCKSR